MFRTAPFAAFLCCAGFSIQAARAAESPLARAPENAPYPRGERLAQDYRHPANAPSLATLSAAPNTVSNMAARSVVNALPETAERSEFGLEPELRMVARVPVTSAQPNAAPRVVYLFDYAMRYKGVPLARFSSQAMAASVRNNNRKVLFVRERNVPTKEALEGLGDFDDAAEGDGEKKEAAVKTALENAKEAARGAEVAAATQTGAPHLEVLTEGPDKAELAWAIIVESKDPVDAFARRYWISADDPSKVLAQESLIFHVDGTVRGHYWDMGHSPFEPPVKDQPLPACYIADEGGKIASDDSGKYTTGGPATLKVLFGPSCRIEDRSGGPAFTATADGDNLKYDATNETQLAQVTAFHWTNAARKYVDGALPEQPDLLREVRTRVNIDDHCNAFWNGSSLNYFRGGDSCPNTACADIVFHEYGHAVDDQLGGIQDGGYSEGFGDALAILMTRDSIVGRDFFGPGEHLRNGKDVVKWPPEDEEVHEVGRIYAGFVWQLTQELESQFAGDKEKAFAIAKGLVLGAAVLNPSDVPDAVALSFLVDKQSHQGAHFQALAKAADSRDIPRPATADEAGNLEIAVAAK